MITSSQAGRLAKNYDKAQLIFVAFVMCGISMVAVPFMPTAGLVGVPLIFYGLANGVISPMQKSLLIQNASQELRGGIVSVDRLIQQFSKTLSTSVVGLLLLVTEISTIFWFFGAISFLSVGLMATVLPRR
jgi:predicted MFS family arabinose efflux permease